MKSFSNLYSGLKSRLEQEFLWYSASNGSDGKDRRPSGAYMFRPATSKAIPVIKRSNKGKEAITAYVYKGADFKTYFLINNQTYSNFFSEHLIGKLVQEVHQYHNQWIGQVIRLYKGADHVEFDWVVGPIPIEYVLRVGYNLLLIMIYLSIL